MVSRWTPLSLASSPMVSVGMFSPKRACYSLEPVVTYGSRELSIVIGGLFRIRPRLRAYPARRPAGRPPDLGQAPAQRWTSRSYALRSGPPAFLSAISHL